MLWMSTHHILLISRTIYIYYCKCDQVLHVQRLDQMGPFHILLAEDQMGLDQMGLDQMGLRQSGNAPLHKRSHLPQPKT